MPKTCLANNCNYFVWSKGYCKYHQNQRTDSKYQLKRESSLKPTKSKRIKPISDKKAEELKEYRLLRDEYMKNHEVCEVKECNRLASDLHHKKPRAYHLCDVSIFMAVCRNHHDMIDKTHDAWARENGYKLNHL